MNEQLNLFKKPFHEWVSEFIELNENERPNINLLEEAYRLGHTPERAYLDLVYLPF
jgi:hypothetical protein